MCVNSEDNQLLGATVLCFLLISLGLLYSSFPAMHSKPTVMAVFLQIRVSKVEDTVGKTMGMATRKTRALRHIPLLRFGSPTLNMLRSGLKAQPQ